MTDNRYPDSDYGQDAAIGDALAGWEQAMPRKLDRQLYAWAIHNIFQGGRLASLIATAVYRWYFRFA